MPQRKSGIDELKKSRKKRLHNLDIKTDLRKTIKTFMTSIEEKNKSEAETKLKNVYKKLDKAAKRNIFKENTVSRRKSKLTKLLHTLNAS